MILNVSIPRFISNLHYLLDRLAHAYVLNLQSMEFLYACVGGYYKDKFIQLSNKVFLVSNRDSLSGSFLNDSFYLV